MANTAKIIDAHAHAFPDDPAGRAWQADMGVTDNKRSGSIEELGKIMAEGQIAHTIVLLFPRSEELYQRLVAASDGKRSDEEIRAEVVQDLHKFNSWGCELGSRDRRFVPFIGINARFMSEKQIRDEIDTQVKAGAKGLKIIPPQMKLYGNDPLLMPVYQRAWELKIPVLSQSGSGGHAPAPGVDHYGRPKYYGEVMSTFPGLKLQLAHLGHGYEDDLVQLLKTYPTVYTDTSLQFSGLGKPKNRTPQQLVDQIRQFGSDRVLLGTNYPFVNPAVYAKILLTELPLTDEERRLIAGENVQRIIDFGDN